MAADTKVVGEPSQAPENAAATQRKIPGNLPYLTATGTLKKVLDSLIEAQRPERFSVDFLANVLKLTGGAARATIPILKRMHFLTGDSVPTELYDRFRTGGDRGSAALQGLRNAFPEIFKRSEYAHVADEAKLKDLIVQITGLKPNDPVANAIRSTFKVIKAYVPAGTELKNDGTPPPLEDDSSVTVRQGTPGELPHQRPSIPVGLAYNINIVVPETSDLNVLNAIFRSVRENLLK